MKNKSLKITIFFIFLLAAITVLVLYFNTNVAGVIAIITMGIASGIFISLFTGYFLPSGLIFKYRHFLYGALAGFGMFLFMSVTYLIEGKTLFLKHLVMMPVSMILVGILLVGFFLRWNYYVIYKQTKLKPDEGEFEIFADSASLTNEDLIGTGRIILTNKRLCFIATNPENVEINFYYSNILSIPELSLRMGIPNGISLQENDAMIRVVFPKFWKKEIKKMMINSSSV